MLKYQFGAIFVGKNSKDRVVWLMFHNYAFILNMVVLQPVSVVKVNKEYFSKEELNNLPITLNWEDSLFGCFSFDLSEVYLILIIQYRSPSITNFNLLDIVLALDLIHFLSSRN